MGEFVYSAVSVWLVSELHYVSLAGVLLRIARLYTISSVQRAVPLTYYRETFLPAYRECSQ